MFVRRRSLFQIRCGHTYRNNASNATILVYGKTPHIFVEIQPGHLINMENVNRITCEGPYLCFDMVNKNIYS